MQTRVNLRRVHLSIATSHTLAGSLYALLSRSSDDMLLVHCYALYIVVSINGEISLIKETSFI